MSVYVNSDMFPIIKHTIGMLEKSTPADLLNLVKRNVRTEAEVTEVTGYGFIVENDKVFTELEFEYYTPDDRRAVSTINVEL